MSPTDFDQLPTSEKRRGRIFTFDPTVSSGTLLQIFSLVVTVAIGYTRLESAQSQQRSDLENVKINAAAESVRVERSLTELKSDVREVQTSINEVNQSLAVLKAREQK